MDLLLAAPVVASSGYSVVIKDKTNSPDCIVLHFYMCHVVSENSVALNFSFLFCNEDVQTRTQSLFFFSENGDLLENSIIIHTLNIIWNVNFHFYKKIN